jgi:hypothetical protein
MPKSKKMLKRKNKSMRKNKKMRWGGSAQKVRLITNEGMEVAINNVNESKIIEDFKELLVTYEENTKCKENDNGCITKNSNALRELYKRNHGNAVIQLLTHLIKNLEKQIPSSKIPSYKILNIESQQTFKRIKSHLDNIKNPPLEALEKAVAIHTYKRQFW